MGFPDRYRRLLLGGVDLTYSSSRPHVSSGLCVQELDAISNVASVRHSQVIYEFKFVALWKINLVKRCSSCEESWDMRKARTKPVSGSGEYRNSVDNTHFRCTKS